MATDANPSLLINATYRVEPEDLEAYKGIALRMAAVANRRDGCSFLKISQDAEDPTTFYLFEGWRDQAALDAHIASDEFQGVVAEAGKLTIRERFADIYTVTDTKAMPMP